MSHNRFFLRVVMSVAAVLLFASASAASTPTALDSAEDVRVFVDRYVDLSNARDLDGLLSMYVQGPVIIQKRKRIDGDFAEKLAENMEKWDDYKVVFSRGELKNIELEAEKAVVEFVLRGRGKFWGLTVTRKVYKALTIERAGEEWKIVEDITSSMRKLE